MPAETQISTGILTPETHIFLNYHRKVEAISEKNCKNVIHQKNSAAKPVVILPVVCLCLYDITVKIPGQITVEFLTCLHGKTWSGSSPQITNSAAFFIGIRLPGSISAQV